MYLKGGELGFKHKTTWFQGCSYPPTDSAHTHGRTWWKETRLTVVCDRHCLSFPYEYTVELGRQNMKIYMTVQGRTWKAPIRGAPGTQGAGQLGEAFCGKQMGGWAWPWRGAQTCTCEKPMSGRAHTLMALMFGFTLPSHISLLPCNDTDMGRLSSECIITLTTNACRVFMVCYSVFQEFYIS